MAPRIYYYFFFSFFSCISLMVVHAFRIFSDITTILHLSHYFRLSPFIWNFTRVMDTNILILTLDYGSVFGLAMKLEMQTEIVYTHGAAMACLIIWICNKPMRHKTQFDSRYLCLVSCSLSVCLHWIAHQLNWMLFGKTNSNKPQRYNNSSAVLFFVVVDFYYFFLSCFKQQSGCIASFSRSVRSLAAGSHSNAST